MRISDWSSDVCSSDLGQTGQDMRLPTALLLAASLLLTGPGASAQIGLPSVRLPDPTQTLPPLPSIGAEPLATVDDMLAGLRLDRIATLLRQNPDRVDIAERGEPAGRAVLIASGLVDAMLLPRREERGGGKRGHVR